jgi:DNA primase
MIDAIKAALTPEAFLAEAGRTPHNGRYSCFFHSDKHPSLTIRGVRWRCWSCGVGGDVIDLAQKYYGISNSEAIKHLASRVGIKVGRPDPAIVRKRNRRRSLVEAFREWEREEAGRLSEFIRTCHQVLIDGPLTYEQAQDSEELFHLLNVAEYRFDILCGSSDKEKLALYQEVGYAGR